MMTLEEALKLYNEENPSNETICEVALGLVPADAKDFLMQVALDKQMKELNTMLDLTLGYDPNKLTKLKTFTTIEPKLINHLRSK